MAYCTQCGKEALMDAKFCSACGARIGSDGGEASRPLPDGDVGATRIAGVNTFRLLEAIAGIALLAFALAVLIYYELPMSPFHKQSVGEAGRFLQLLRTWHALPVVAAILSIPGGIFLLRSAYRGR